MSTQVLWYTTRGAGAVSLVLLSAVVVLGILGVTRFEAPGWPRFLTMGLHRNLALVAAIFLALHIVTAVVDPFTSLGLAALVPFRSSYRTFWLGLGAIAFELLLAIIVTSLLRDRLGHAAWRLIHWLAYGSWPVAAVHGWGTGTDAMTAWMLGIDVVCVVAVAAAIGWRLRMRAPATLAIERSRIRQELRRDVRS